VKSLRSLAVPAALAVLFAACAAPAAWRRETEIGDRALRHGRLPEAEAALEPALARAEPGWPPR